MLPLLLVVFLLLVLVARRISRPSRPPGPPSIPVLGCLPFIDAKRGVTDWVLDPQITSHPLATLTLGPMSVTVINDFHLAKQLFDKEEFSGKTVDPSQLSNRYFNNSTQGIINTQGAQWTTQRRFGLKTLKDFGFGKKSIEDSIHYEVDEMIDNSFTGSGDILLGNNFNIPIINVLWRMVANKRFSPAKPEDLQLIERVSWIFEHGRKQSLLPAFITKRLPASLMKHTLLGERRNNQRGIRDHLVAEVEEHQAQLELDNQKDFIDVYLAEIAKDKSQEFNVFELVGCIFDFFMAGTETSSTTLKWVVLYLTLHQDVQDRCREELQAVLGSRKVSVADLPSLPYLQATIAEVQRISCVAPTSLLHRTMAVTKVEGFTFPVNSAFLANLSFFMNDPAHFHLPGEFNPGRFIAPDGRFSRHERLVPFSLGRRYCMGEILARNEVFMFTASLVQSLQLLPPYSHPLPDPANYTANLTKIPWDFHLRVVKL